MSKSFWSHQADLPGLRAVIDPNDEAGFKNAYIDLLHKTVLRRYGAFGPTDRVLDLGCGSGRLALWLAPKVRWVHGVDSHDGMVRRAVTAVRASGLGNVTVTLTDGTHLPFVDVVFTRVTCVWVLQHVLDDRQLRVLLSELARVTSPHGRLIFVERTSDEPDEPWLPRNVIFRRRAGDYERAFADTGLRCVEAWPVQDGGPICGSARLNRLVVSGRISPRLHLPIVLADLAMKRWHLQRDGVDYVYCCQRVG